MSQPIFDLAEIALLGAILYHAMNGARLLCVEWGTGYRVQKRLFWWVMGIGVVLFVFGAYPIMMAALRGGGASELGEVIR
jgi:succinate dehydrogenase / fumarate reductase cytochrome b subunit